MAIAAHFEPQGKRGGKRRGGRRSLLLDAQGATASGAEAAVLVHNASTTGLLIESRAKLAEGEDIDIDLPEAGPTRAQVVWSSGTLYGCEFAEPIAAAVLSAAELRSAVAASPELDLRSEPQLGETLGHRLQRLRTARGLTMAQVAEELGVSKPTVWAWEHGKARPVDARLGKLAEVLHCEPGDLVPGSGSAMLIDLVEDSRSRIAREAGTTPDRVRILIEL